MTKKFELKVGRGEIQRAYVRIHGFATSGNLLNMSIYMKKSKEAHVLNTAIIV